MPDGSIDWCGEVLECEPPTRLVFTFACSPDEGGAPEKPSRVAFDLSPYGPSVKLTVTHDGFEDGSRVYLGIRHGWPAILSSMKTLLETGTAIEHPWKG